MTRAKYSLSNFQPLASVPYVLILLLSLLTNCRIEPGKSADNGLNRLQFAGSPYLREHADNPVDWYEWGPEALEKAKKENKPLLISIGYASCHWCHVMERESFMDTTVARMMNENFVAIKIDREERPDIDQIYLEAAQLISGRGGWPLNAFAMADGKPFYAATYFPKDDWLTLLEQVSTAYQSQYDELLKQAAGITQGLNTNDVMKSPTTSDLAITTSDYENLFNEWISEFDTQHGGFAGAPKFPMPAVWEFALQHHYLTQDKTSLALATTTLDNMANGGIYDHLAGGFARYATDENWNIPHFEKMLYDNAQLVSLYAHAYQATGNTLYADVVVETLDFIKNELTSKVGGFYSSLNADSEGEEGKFYVWKAAEIDSLLQKDDANLFKAYYHITPAGNWENGKNILSRTGAQRQMASSYDREPEDRKSIERSEKILLEARNKRTRPSLDDKVLTAWNALMLKGYLDAFAALGTQEYLESAIANASFLEKKMLSANGKLWRSYKDGKAGIDAFLDDYALLSDAYVSLYQATFDIHWLETSQTIMQYALTHFRDKETGLFFYTSDVSESLIARKMETTDNVIPSSNSVLARVIFHHSVYHDDDSLREMSKRMINTLASDVKTQGHYFSNWASLTGLVLYEPFEVAIMGNEALAKSRMLMKNYLPTAIYMGGTKENLPLLKNKLTTGRTMIYVCRDRICKLPVETADQALAQIRAK